MGVEDRNKEGRTGERVRRGRLGPCPGAKPMAPSSGGEEDSRTLIFDFLSHFSG